MRVHNLKSKKIGHIVDVSDLEIHGGLILTGCHRFISRGRLKLGFTQRPEYDAIGRRHYIDLIAFESKEANICFQAEAAEAYKNVPPPNEAIAYEQQSDSGLMHFCDADLDESNTIIIPSSFQGIVVTTFQVTRREPLEAVVELKLESGLILLEWIYRVSNGFHQLHPPQVVDLDSRATKKQYRSMMTFTSTAAERAFKISALRSIQRFLSGRS